MAQKPILYLDQPYLSNMAKAKFGLSNSMSMADGKFYNSLYDAIHDAVFSDRLVCAGSDYQLAEASLDDRLEEAIGRVRADLIGGLSFLDFYTLLTGQVVEDALHNAGWPPNGAAWWETVFTNDPTKSFSQRTDFNLKGHPGKVYVQRQHPQELINLGRQLKENYRVQAALNQASPSLSSASLGDELRRQQSSFIATFIGPEAISQGEYLLATAGPTTREMAEQFVKYTKQLWTILRVIFKSDYDRIVAFLKTEDMLAVPLLDIYCSMTAALDHNYSLRAPSGSDAIDIPILATVLPHCDLVTTDTFMAEIVNQLHLDKKYTVQVLSASAQDRSALLQWVGRLVPSVH